MAWFTAKEWKNRLVEFAGRRNLKNVSTNETTVYDVTRNEGQVSQEGDSFSATTMNDLEQRISDAFAEAEEANTQLTSELYSDAVIGTEALNLQYAIQHVCYYMALNSSWRGRFNCIDGWFDFDIIKSADDYCSGIVNGHTLSVTYSFYRKPGADAVLKKLGDPSFASKAVNPSSQNYDNGSHVGTTIYNTGVTGKELYQSLFFTPTGHYGYGGGSESTVTDASYNPNTGQLTVHSLWCRLDGILLYYTV